MKKVSVVFYDDLYKKLADNADGKNIKLSQYIRDLINLGLKVEELSNKKDGDNDKNIILEKLEEIKNFFKNNMISTQESLYLGRYLVSNLPEKSTQDHEEILKEAKIKSVSFVEGAFINSKKDV